MRARSLLDAGAAEDTLPPMSRLSAGLSAAILVGTVGAWGAPGAGKRVIELHDDVVPGRPGRSELRVVYGMRSSLARCAALRSPEEQAATTTASYRLVLAPSGDVASATVTMDGPAPPAVRTCMQDALSRVIFDPPEGGGATLTGTLVLAGTGSTGTSADAAPTPARLVAFPRGVQGPSRALPTLTLPSVNEPREGRAIDAAVRAARRCVDAEGVATIDVTMLVGPDGALFEATVGKGAGASDALVTCVREGLKTGGAPPSVTEVSATLRLEKGSVRVER